MPEDNIQHLDSAGPMNGFVVNFSSLQLDSDQNTTLIGSLNAIFGQMPSSEWVKKSTNFFFPRKSTFENKTIKSGHKMPIGVKKSAKDDFQIFRLRKVPSFLRKFTFEHKTTQSDHKMPIWVKKIGRTRRFYKGVWDCFRQTPALVCLELENN